MDLHDKPFVIGIDLGTTNCAVSYADIRALKEKGSTDSTNKKDLIKVFNLPQLTGQGEFTKVEILPSFLYLPGDYDISKESLRHPWKKTHDWFAGVFARDHGSKVPSRLVSSAKSWLCHAGADREAKILPWGAQKVEKISPVTATAQYLKHIKSAWNHSVKDEDLFLENQVVVITVPASFNETARDLTLKAASEAGFGDGVILLEEPLAAFYSWLINHETDWHEKVRPDDLILVCDVGGGTTDFSLITLRESEGTPRFERLAVGDHLILGGDNIDLALAKRVESKFKGKQKLTSDKWKTLCHRCREAKERLFENNGVPVRITIKGEGRSLIAGTLAADLTWEDLESVLFEEFFAGVSPKDGGRIDQGQEIADFGLPFEKESSITAHIVHFLEKHRDEIREHLGKTDPVPDFILFNGGTLKPSLVKARIRESIRDHYRVAQDHMPAILENNIPYLAVGVGASYYGLVKQGIGVRVGSGSPRGYYLGVETVGGSGQKTAVCFVERGLDEGTPIELSGHEFEVLANQPVSFDVYSSSFRSGDHAGDIVEIDQSLTPMPPIRTVIGFGKQEASKKIPVTIAAEYTEVGTLAIRCLSKVSDHRWGLHFQLRDSVSATDGMVPDGHVDETFDDAMVRTASEEVVRLFSDPKSDEAALAGIAKRLEKITGKPRNRWPLSFLRAVADALVGIAEAREHSAVHEAKWLNLAGFCSRPGFGDAFDETRMKKLWKVYLSGLIYDKSKQNRVEWWIFTRRIAGGMKAGQQRQFFQNVSADLVLKKNEKVKLPPQEYAEMWMAMANMERLLVKDKVVLAKSLLNIIVPGKNTKALVWSLARLGARELLYGSVDRVVPPKEVCHWMKRLFKFKWKPADPIDTAMIQMGRITSDRTRDISEEDRTHLLSWLADREVSGDLLNPVREKVTIKAREKSQQFGESLPTGLVLKNGDGPAE